jgi:hypothetical protein
MRNLPLAFWGMAVALLLAATRGGAADRDDFLDRVDRAADRAVEFLRKRQEGDGGWNYQDGRFGGGMANEQNVGTTALVGLALLASNLPPDDPAVARAEALVRGYAPTLGYTYAVSLAAMFLESLDKDRGSTRNARLVAGLLDKLINGRASAAGGWGYYCPNQATGMDNSNSQFALLALYVGRRHHLNGAREVIFGEDRRFRESQGADGSWTYGPGLFANRPTPSMTCVGLVALRMAYELNRERTLETAKFESGEAGQAGSGKSRPSPPPSILRDPQVKRAFEYLATSLRGGVDVDHHLTYYLWSLERVCLIYSQPKLEGLDWYRIGGEKLLALQQADGSWKVDGRHGVNCDTAFALLFLRRKNLLDITEAKFVGAGLNEAGKATAPRKPVRAPEDAGKPLSDEEAQTLGRKLADADPVTFDEIVKILTEAKVSAATAALRMAIPEVAPLRQARLRDALVARFVRLKLQSLREYLRTDDVEYRRAAARAVGEKGARDLIPDLIPVLITDPTGRDAALQSLRQLSGQNYGPNPDLWLRWWQRQSEAQKKSGKGDPI